MLVAAVGAEKNIFPFIFAAARNTKEIACHHRQPSVGLIVVVLLFGRPGRRQTGGQQLFHRQTFRFYQPPGHGQSGRQERRNMTCTHRNRMARVAGKRARVVRPMERVCKTAYKNMHCKFGTFFSAVTPGAGRPETVAM